MIESTRIISLLTSGELSSQDKSRLVKDFSQELGWEPGEAIEPTPELGDVFSGHLLVEHGLEISAVITFIISPTTFNKLTANQKNKSLELSYNNLVDWHIYIEQNQVTYVFNRTQPATEFPFYFTNQNTDSLQSTLFDQITGKAPNPNFPTLDIELVNNISYWKRNLAAELSGEPDLADYAALFNSIIFTRAAEDHQKKITGVESKLLLDNIRSVTQVNRTIKNIIYDSLSQFIDGEIPEYIFDPIRLESFNNLSESLIFDLFLSFYKSRSVPYGYDFAVMSKHALTRIYEKYVALLSFDELNNQLSFFPILPTETYSKKFGSVYTPEFIARFFSRYIQNNVPLKTFRSMKVIDPACGSGIFLRTLLEFQTAPNFDPLSSNEIKEQFSNVFGVDIDENATQSTRLSIALLYLVLMSGELPEDLNLFSENALSFLSESRFQNYFDLVISNPPYISTEHQSDEIRELSRQVMGDFGVGKIDTYLPFVKLSLEILKPGGIGMFVIPHSFLKLSGAQKFREHITELAWIRCIVDLSEITVFKDHGSYVILLIFQKKFNDVIHNTEPMADVIVCKDFVGHAFADYFKSLQVKKEFYEIFTIEQKNFTGKEWRIESPSEHKVLSRLEDFEPLDKFLDISQGIVTGKDSLFITHKSDIPENEYDIWKPLLPDREMIKYKVPRATQKILFYPKIKNRTVSIEQIETDFPITYQYLISKREQLLGEREQPNWWVPHRLRDEEKVFQPKLVTPHLVLLPKFGLDLSGEYAVSRTPFLISKSETSSIEILTFFLGILNSDIGAWLISSYSDKYSKGYARLEVGTLKKIPVPNPAKVSPYILSKIIDLTTQQVKKKYNIEIDVEIGHLISEIYHLSNHELSEIGLLGGYAFNSPS